MGPGVAYGSAWVRLTHLPPVSSAAGADGQHVNHVARARQIRSARVRVLRDPVEWVRGGGSREATTTYAGADGPEAQRGRPDAWRGARAPGRLQGVGSLGGDLSSLARAVRRDEGRRREAVQGAGAGELAAEADRRGPEAGKRARRSWRRETSEPVAPTPGVLALQDRLGISERRACQLAGQHAGPSAASAVVAEDDAALRAGLRALSGAPGGVIAVRMPSCSARAGRSTSSGRGGCGARKVYGCPERRRKRQRLGDSTVPAARLRAERPDHVWAFDFQFDQTADGHLLKLLHVVDQFHPRGAGDQVRAEHRRGRDRRRP